MTGCGRAAGAQGSVRSLAGGPEAVRLNARGVRAAMAGSGVARQTLVMRRAACAAATSAGTLVQMIHV